MVISQLQKGLIDLGFLLIALQISTLKGQFPDAAVPSPIFHREPEGEAGFRRTEY